jgi:poly-gamma-glutamate capsule biosynthesis protein CapA/YwtB (metallophosphatase superfamily)
VTGRSLVICVALATPALPSAAARGAMPEPIVRISYVGDMAMAASPDDGASFFSRVGPALAGNVVLGNLEGTLTDRGSSKCAPSSTECFAFRAPPSYARLLKRAGFTVLNVANNHAADYGADGQADTLEALQSAGLAWTGRPGQITYLRAGGTRVALIGSAPYPWAQNLLDIPGAALLVERAAASADLVIVTIHAGAEGIGREHVRPGPETFLDEPRGDAVAFSHAVIRAGADLVVGSGPHVLRGMEWYRGRLIAYSLGNFLGNGTLSIGGKLGASAVLHVRLRTNGSWAGGRLLPMRLVKPGIPEPDPGGAALRLVRTLSRADFGERGVRVSRAGALATPP